MPGRKGLRSVSAGAGLSPFVDHALGTDGNVTNSVEPALSERMYPPKTLARLCRLKQEWDPGNLFRRNHSVVRA